MKQLRDAKNAAKATDQKIDGAIEFYEKARPQTRARGGRSSVHQVLKSNATNADPNSKNQD